MAYGAKVSEAATEAPAPKKLPKVLHHIELTAAQNGGAMAEHSFTHYEHKPEVHVFGPGDGAKLAAHLEKHLSIKMPGRAEGTVAAPTSGEVSKPSGDE
jgi:hypothetical protein